MRSEESGRDSRKLTRTQLARRQDILKAAITVINRDGYAAASVEQIAKEAGTSKSTVLYHFKSKDAIHTALVGSIFEDGAAYMTPYLLRAKNYREKLQNYILSNLRFIAENVETIAALQQIAQNMPRKDFDASSELLENDAPTTRLTQMLVEGQEAREFGSFDPGIMAITIRLVIDNASFYLLDHPTIDVEHHIAEIVQLFDRTTIIKQEE